MMNVAARFAWAETLDAVPDLVRLAQLASAPYDRFVWEDHDEARRVAEFLVSRGIGEIAPPVGRLIRLDGAPAGMIAFMNGTDLQRRRVKAAYALAREDAPRVSPDAARRARLASRTFCQVPPRDYYLARLAVDSAFRGQGVGAWLLSHLFAEAQSADSASCWLEVDPDNGSAIGLYERAGFRIIGEAEVKDDASGRALRFAHMRAPVRRSARQEAAS